MEHLKLLIKLLYYIILNQWRNKNKVYLIITYLIGILFIFQLLSTNVQLVYLLKNTSESVLYNYLTYFLNFMFILWIITPLFFGFKLSSMRDFNQFKYLPIKSSVFVAANTILGNLGVGPLITIIIVYTILIENFYLNITSFLLITFLLLLFINISGITSFLINNYTLNQRHFKSRFFQIAIWIMLIIGFLIMIFMRENNLVRSVYIFLPSVQVLSGIKGIIEGNTYISIFPFLGLCLYFIIGNYLYFRSFIKKGIYQPHSKKVKTKYRFQKSYFNVIENLIKNVILNFRLRMIVIKEIIYLTKNNRLILWYSLELLTAYIFFSSIINDLSDPFVIATIVISFLGVFNLSLYINIFAFDSDAVQNFYIYPIYFKNVFLSKNLANLMISLVLLFFISLIIIINTKIDFAWLQLMILFCLFLFSNIIAQSFGNILSIYFAMKIPFNQVFGIFNPYSSVIISLVIMLITLAPPILFSILNIAENYIFAITFILLLLSFYVYVICLNYASKKSLEKRMIILNELI